jgi:hypothetical protein
VIEIDSPSALVNRAMSLPGAKNYLDEMEAAV